jgi:DNA-binding transcriptional MerR regulator
MKNQADRLTLDDICALVEMNKRTIRYYIQKGLVARPEGTGKGAFYGHQHLAQLLAIRKWKAAGVSLERIQDILLGENTAHRNGAPVPPPLARKQGAVEVWSHLLIDDGIELHIEPRRAGLTPEQVRSLFQEITELYRKTRKESL